MKNVSPIITLITMLMLPLSMSCSLIAPFDTKDREPSVDSGPGDADLDVDTVGDTDGDTVDDRDADGDDVFDADPESDCEPDCGATCDPPCLPPQICLEDGTCFCPESACGGACECTGDQICCEGSCVEGDCCGDEDCSGRCEGTADRCGSFMDSSCNDQLNCSWDFSRCEGEALICGEISQIQCGLPNCYCEWDSEGEVCISNGTSFTCTSATESTCSSHCGCTQWRSCNGSALGCDTFEDEGGCQSQSGCIWSPPSCDSDICS